MNNTDIHPLTAIEMFTCSYYQGIGSCSGGCREEPACQVDEPEDGWVHYLPGSFDLETHQRRIDGRRKAHELKRWLDAEKRWKERPVLADMKTTGVYPINPASPMHEKGVRFAAYFRWENGSNVTSWHESETEAWNKLAEHVESNARFWAEKEAWKNAGDRTADSKWGTRPPKISPFRNVIRVGGAHYVAGHLGRSPGSGDHKGFGGRIIRWRWLDDPEGAVHETDSLWYQGSIPQKWQDRLPDNAVFVPIPCNRCGVENGHEDDCKSNLKNWGKILNGGDSL